ncbi:D-hexose-6-phosphate mutarotase [Noviherbaspirillum sp. CPCC 100848]|uniref:glucose-6-phosphate 1-epimerase n=1 Tax=Noviherbaspirillum album TaxID=3080276 RepID=A0ABU6J4W7_9BURK|nr:D-hexose-6-phosphate mutarotase [Noviherbaspirillum sp. CPCC 100848]MEC4718476.1 D-hexose-6-phosphate mutarotase [Noviherbaspirillum sp. CPCC 100848]
MTKIYEYTQQPHFWIVHDEQGYWQVPARNNGWQDRSPFVGHAVNLREVADLGGIDLGLPAASAADSFTQELQALPGLTLSNAQGDSAFVTRQGAQVVSWKTADGRERMYLSASTGGMTRADDTIPAAAIRGGVPVCFPQFSDRGPMVKHGFVRSLPWQVATSPSAQSPAMATFVIEDDAQTHQIWPHAFHAEVGVVLDAGRLVITLTATNRGDVAFPFTAALHTYFRVDDIRQVELQGLQQVRYQDATAGCVEVVQQDASVKIAAELDRVYMSPPKKLLLLENGQPSLQIEQVGFEDTVVWNPGPVKAAALPDFPDQDWLHMICVEAACVITPVTLAPGQTWTGGQILSLPSR